MQIHLTGNVFLIRGRDTSGVLAYLKREGTIVQGNADVYVRTYGQFGIDDAHDLTSRALGRAMGERGRTFIICAAGMTNEAQNALLKTIEDPPDNARFFFIVPSPEMLLATVRSRAQMCVLNETINNKQDILDASAFLATAPNKRLDLLKPLLEKGDDDKRDIGTVITFLSSLERALSSYPHENRPEGLHTIYNARKYIGDKGALLKPLLESVALLVPRI